MGTNVGATVDDNVNLAPFYGTTGRYAVFQSNYFFAGQSTVFDGAELWKSDGRSGGTGRVKDIVVGEGGSTPSQLTPASSQLFFVANDGTTGYELWRTDGTEGGTRRLTDIRAGSGSSYPNALAVAGDVLYFFANDGVNGESLWRSDGTATGTVPLANAAGYEPGWSNITATESAVFFNLGSQLWKIDGTPAGTSLVATIPNRYGQTFLQEVAVGDTLYFLAHDDAHGYELWQSNGTAAGTRPVKDLPDLPGLAAGALTRVGNSVYLIGGVSDLWHSNGTEDGTELVTTFDVLSSQAFPSQLTALGDQLLLVADDANDGYELWRSDGTANGTRVVKDIRPGTVSSHARGVGRAGDHLYVEADDVVREVFANGSQPALWTSDGTAAGTEFVTALGSPYGLEPGGRSVTSFILSRSMAFRITF